MQLSLRTWRDRSIVLVSALVGICLLVSGCTHITQSMRQAIDEGRTEEAIAMGESWMSGTTPSDGQEERMAVMLLTAEARFDEALKADTADALRAFQLRYQTESWAKVLRDRAYQAEAALVLRDQVMPSAAPRLLLKFAEFYPNTTAARQARVLAAEQTLELIKQQPSLLALREFQSQFTGAPGTERFLAEARQLEFAVALREALEGRTVAGLRAFRDRYRPAPGSEAETRTRDLELQLSFEEAKRAGDETSWRGFISSYQGWTNAAPLIAQAKSVITELAFGVAVRGGIVALEAFGAQHPEENWPERVATAINTILLVPIGGYLAGHPLNHADALQLWDEFPHRTGLLEAFENKRADFTAEANRRNDSGGRLLLYLLASPCADDATEALALEDALWREAEESNALSKWEEYLNLAPPTARRGEAESTFVALRDIERASTRGLSAEVTHTVVRKDEVDLYLNVTDCHRERVSGLSKSAFRLYEDAKARPISDFLGVNDDRPLDIMFAIDLSGSMETEQDAVRNSVQQFADQFSFRMRNLSLGLITFNEELVSKQRPQPNEASFQRWLSGMTRTSGGNGEDSVGALVESSRLFSSRAERAVIVMTDESLQANRAGRALLKHKPAADGCMVLQQAASCFQKAASEGAMNRCAAQIDRADPGHHVQQLVQRCMRQAGVGYCQRSIASELGQNATQCAEPIPAWSPIVDEISSDLSANGTRAFFIISEGPETFHRLGAQLGGKAYEVPDNTTSEAPYTQALLDIADRLSSQYVLTFKRQPGAEIDLSKLHVVVHPENLLRTIAMLAADSTRSLHVGGDIQCPTATAIAGTSTRYRTSKCGAQWNAEGELSQPGVTIDAVVLAGSNEFHLGSDHSLTIRAWPADTMVATLTEQNITAIYDDGNGGVWAEGTFDGQHAFAAISAQGIVGEKRPVDPTVTGPLVVLRLPSEINSSLCFTDDGTTRRCSAAADGAWSSDSVRGLVPGFDGTKTRFAGAGKGRPLAVLTKADGSLLRSIDGGRNWYPTLRLPGAGHPVVVLSDDGMVCASTASQMSCSEDDGLSWAEVTGLAGVEASHPALYRGKLFALAGRQFLRADRVEAREVPSTKAFFDTASATPNNRILPFLSEIAQRAKADRQLMIRVEGHADKRGDADKNLTLSAERADAVSAILLRLGVPDAQIETAALGETQPIRDSRGVVQDDRSRRVELMLLRSAPAQTWFESQCGDE